MIRKTKAVHATFKIMMLRCYGWLWEDFVEDMIRVVDSFLRQLIVNVLAQFVKHGHMSTFTTVIRFSAPPCVSNSING